MSDPILSAEAWLLDLDRLANGGAYTHNQARIRLVAHDAALRSRLAEVEAERDEAAEAKWRIALATTEGENDEDVPWDNLATGVESLRNQWIAEFQRAETSEARLAEAIELLRRLMVEDDATIIPDIEAFIEAHGTTG